MTFWLSTSNRNSFKLVRDYQKYKDKLADRVSIIPHYAIWTCPYCAYLNYTMVPDNCISGGRYCCPDPDGGEEPGKGRDVVMEDLR